MKPAAALLTLACALAPGTHAATIDLRPVDQATDCNGVFRCGGPGLDPGQSDFYGAPPPFVQRGGLEFDIAGLAGVTRAILSLEATGLHGISGFDLHPAVLEIHGFTGDGQLQLADLGVNHLLATSRPIDALTVYTFDVTPFVAQQVDAGDAYVGFAVRDIQPNSNASFYGAKFLNITAATVPMIPEPGSGALLAAGVLVLAGLARRRPPPQEAKTSQV